MVIFHIVLKSLIVIVLHLFTGDATNLRILVGLVVRLCHSDLILRVEGKLRVRTLELSHKGGGQGRFTLRGLRHRREVLLVALMGASLGGAVGTAADKRPRVNILG